MVKGKVKLYNVIRVTDRHVLTESNKYAAIIKY
jgi:hypothetical protein